MNHQIANDVFHSLGAFSHIFTMGIALLSQLSCSTQPDSKPQSREQEMAAPATVKSDVEESMAQELMELGYSPDEDELADNSKELLETERAAFELGPTMIFMATSPSATPTTSPSIYVTPSASSTPTSSPETYVTPQPTPTPTASVLDPEKPYGCGEPHKADDPFISGDVDFKVRLRGVLEFSVLPHLVNYGPLAVYHESVHVLKEGVHSDWNVLVQRLGTENRVVVRQWQLCNLESGKWERTKSEFEGEGSANLYDMRETGKAGILKFKLKMTTVASDSRETIADGFFKSKCRVPFLMYLGEYHPICGSQDCADPIMAVTSRYMGASYSFTWDGGHQPRRYETTHLAQCESNSARSINRIKESMSPAVDDSRKNVERQTKVATTRLFRKDNGRETTTKDIFDFAISEDGVNTNTFRKTYTNPAGANNAYTYAATCEGLHCPFRRGGEKMETLLRTPDLFERVPGIPAAYSCQPNNLDDVPDSGELGEIDQSIEAFRSLEMQLRGFAAPPKEQWCSRLTRQ